MRRPVGDVLCSKYVLLQPELHTDTPAMGQLSSDRQADATELAGEIVRELEQLRVRAGAWFFDIARVRQSLREADTLLRRLEDAIIRSQPPASLDAL